MVDLKVYVHNLCKSRNGRDLECDHEQEYCVYEKITQHLTYSLIRCIWTY